MFWCSILDTIFKIVWPRPSFILCSIKSSMSWCHTTHKQLWLTALHVWLCSGCSQLIYNWLWLWTVSMAWYKNTFVLCIGFIRCMVHDWRPLFALYEFLSILQHDVSCGHFCDIVIYNVLSNTGYWIRILTDLFVAEETRCESLCNGRWTRIGIEPNTIIWFSTWRNKV